MLAAHGIGRGDRVAILLPQMPVVAASHIAIYKLGAVALPLAMLFGVEAIEYRLQDSGARALITNAQGVAKLGSLRATAPGLELVLSIDGAAEGVDDFHALLARAASNFTAAPTTSEDPALMIYTSGTTGPPKGALHAHRVLLGHLPGIEFPHEFLPQPGDRFWTPADWAWAGGLLNVLLPGLTMPVVAHKAEKFEPERAFSLIKDGVPTSSHADGLHDASAESRSEFGWRSVGSGGEALGPRPWIGENRALGWYQRSSTGPNAISSSPLAPGSACMRFPARSARRCRANLVAGSRRTLPARDRANRRDCDQAPDPVMFLEFRGKGDATRGQIHRRLDDDGRPRRADDAGYVQFIGRKRRCHWLVHRSGPTGSRTASPGIRRWRSAAVVQARSLRTEIVKPHRTRKPASSFRTARGRHSGFR